MRQSHTLAEFPQGQPVRTIRLDQSDHRLCLRRRKLHSALVILDHTMHLTSNEVQMLLNLFNLPQQLIVSGYGLPHPLPGCRGARILFFHPTFTPSAFLPDPILILGLIVAHVAYTRHTVRRTFPSSTVLPDEV